MASQETELNWCGGFFDGEGSFSFAPECPWINVVNTNPLAVSHFCTVMKKNGVNFAISERSKPSKSSKKKRWDMYLQGKDQVEIFLRLMQTHIFGKQMQLQLISNFYADISYKTYSDKIRDYHELMQYYNQSNEILIVDESKLFEKIGFVPKVQQHILVSKEASTIVPDSFNSLGYLCGIIDAEGSFYINLRDSKRSTLGRFIPWMSITNTNRRIISCCCSTLRNNNVSYHVQFRTTENRNRGRWDIVVSGVKRIHKLMPLIQHDLIIKNRQADLLYRYCSARLLDLVGENKLANSFKESIEALNKEN
jgi:hypothetical protein